MDDPTKAQFGENEELNVDYANNASLEPTIWDLKLIFGEYSQRVNSVEWHTSVTVPWALAKLLTHYLQVNIAVHEICNGKINIPKQMWPETPPPLTLEQERDPEAKAIFDTIQKHNKEFVDSLK